MKHQTTDGGKTVIIGTVDQYMNPCYVCGVVSETRPYGENGQEICADCGMLPLYKKMVTANMEAALSNAEVLVFLHKA